MIPYNVIEVEGEDAGRPRVDFEEVFCDEGPSWVRMRVKMPGNEEQMIEFDSPAQVEQCMWRMQEYLKQRNTFRAARSEAAEP